MLKKQQLTNVRGLILFCSSQMAFRSLFLMQENWIFPSLFTLLKTDVEILAFIAEHSLEIGLKVQCSCPHADALLQLCFAVFHFFVCF